MRGRVRLGRAAARPSCRGSTRACPRGSPRAGPGTAAPGRAASGGRRRSSTRPGTNASISRSRSTISRTATDWTRPAESARLHALPQQRRDLVAHEAVEDPAGLLRVDEPQVDRAAARVNASRIASRVISVKVTRFAVAGSTPRSVATWNAIASPSRSKSVASTTSPAALQGTAELGDVALRVLRHRVLDREVALDVHAELAPRQVADVPVGGSDGVVAAQVLLDRLRLGRRLDDHERLGHTVADGTTGRRKAGDDAPAPRAGPLVASPRSRRSGGPSARASSRTSSRPSSATTG